MSRHWPHCVECASAQQCAKAGSHHSTVHQYLHCVPHIHTNTQGHTHWPCSSVAPAKFRLHNLLSRGRDSCSRCKIMLHSLAAGDHTTWSFNRKKAPTRTSGLRKKNPKKQKLLQLHVAVWPPSVHCRWFAVLFTLSQITFADYFTHLQIWLCTHGMRCTTVDTRTQIIWLQDWPHRWPFKWVLLLLCHALISRSYCKFI